MTLLLLLLLLHILDYTFIPLRDADATLTAHSLTGIPSWVICSISAFFRNETNLASHLCDTLRITKLILRNKITADAFICSVVESYVAAFSLI